MAASSSPTDAAPPGGQDKDPTQARAPLAADPIVGAATKAVASMFDSLAAKLPDLVASQAPGDSPLPEFTKAMIAELQAQLQRALGLPDKGGSE